jgi:hypothetical protein
MTLTKIRWHKTKRGWEWQYWNYRDDVLRWCRYTREPLTPDEARQRIAQFCYGCDPKTVTID